MIIYPKSVSHSTHLCIWIGICLRYIIVIFFIFIWYMQGYVGCHGEDGRIFRWSIAFQSWSFQDLRRRKIVRHMWFKSLAWFKSYHRRGGGGGRGEIAPLHHNAISEFFDTFGHLSVHVYKPTSMSFLRTEYLKYQQNIERSSSFITGKCFSVRSLRSLEHIFSQCVLSVYYCRL